VTQKEKEAGNEAFKAGNFEEALRLYTQALERDPENKDVSSKLYNNRAAVLSKVRCCWCTPWTPRHDWLLSARLSGDLAFLFSFGWLYRAVSHRIFSFSLLQIGRNEEAVADLTKVPTAIHCLRLEDMAAGERERRAVLS
jgi:tetratricopeptide (TPR) repeat protein